MRRRCSDSIPGRIAAATMNPRKSRAMTILIFHRASAPTMIARATRVVTAVLRAVAPMARGLWPSGESCKPMWNEPEERIVVHARRHGIVLARPLARAGAAAVAGGACLVAGWPFSPTGAALLVVAAVAATAGVWRGGRGQGGLAAEELVG